MYCRYCLLNSCQSEQEHSVFTSVFQVIAPSSYLVSKEPFDCRLLSKYKCTKQNSLQTNAHNKLTSSPHKLTDNWIDNPLKQVATLKSSDGKLLLTELVLESDFVIMTSSVTVRELETLLDTTASPNTLLRPKFWKMGVRRFSEGFSNQFIGRGTANEVFVKEN